MFFSVPPVYSPGIFPQLVIAPSVSLSYLTLFQVSISQLQPLFPLALSPYILSAWPHRSVMVDDDFQSAEKTSQRHFFSY